MPKVALKKRITENQDGRCSLTNVKLPKKTSLYDTDRINPKANGGDYTDENTRTVIPTAHMKRHGTLKVRTEQLDKLKSLVDDRNQVMKLKNKVNNQMLAFKRFTDNPLQRTIDFLEAAAKEFEGKVRERDRDVAAWLQEIRKDHPIIEAILSVKACGSITAAYCLTYIDINEARHASSLWSYVGLDKPSHSRYEKGTAGGGNKTLRTVLYTMATSQIKLKGPYRVVYDNVKFRLSNSDRMVKTYNTEGKLVEKAWKDTKPSHRHGAGIRAIIKHFLADLWMVWRTLEGLPTDPIYAEAVLGGNHRTIMPEERGWQYQR